MPLVADEHDSVALLGILDRLEMHFRDQRAGGIDGVEPPVVGHATNLRGHPVGREQEHRSLGHLLHAIDKHGPLPHEPVHHMLVVHDLVKHVDRRPVQPDRRLERLDRHVHSRTEAAGAGQQNLHARGDARGAAGPGPSR